MNYLDKTKEELIEDLQKLQQECDLLKTSYSKDISEFKQAKETLSQQKDALSKLNNFSIGLSKLSLEDNLEAFIVRQLKEITGAEAAIFSEYNHTNRTLTSKHIEIESGLLRKVINLLGQQVNRIHSEVNDEMYREMTEELIGMRRTLFEATFGAISRPVGARIQTLLRADRFIGIAYLIDGKLYGTSLLVMRKDQHDPPREILENFVYLAAVSLRRRQTEETLRKSEEKWRKLVTTIPDFIALHDLKGMYIFLNHFAEGFSEKDIIGKSLYDFISEDSKEEYRRYFEACIQTKQTQQFVFSGYGNNKVIRIYENYLVPILEEERIVNIMAIAMDITERKQAEELLKESTEWLNEAQKLAHIGVWNWKPGMDTVTWTDELYHIAGLDPMLPAPTYKEHSSLYTPESWELLKTGVEKAMETGESYQFELELIRPNGDTRYVNAFGGVKYDSKGQVNELFGTVQDITERKRNEEELRCEKENFRNSLDDSPLGVRISSTEGNTIYANKTLLNLYGYDGLRELQETPLQDRYTPESYLQSQKRKQQRECGDQSATDYEISIIRKDGEIRHLQVFRKEIIWTGIKQFQIIYEDITRRKLTEAALKESEARFRSIFENSFVGISLARPGGGLLQVNLAYARMYGYENPEILLSEVSDTNVLFANPEERKEVLQELHRKGFMEAREFELIRRDGSHFFVMVSAGEIRDSEGKLLYNQAAHIDLTERRKMEEELRSSKELLEKLNQHLLEIRENERASISREIHDQIGQSLTALKLDLNQMHKYINADAEAVTKLESMVGLISDTIKDVQRISSDLRPGILDELGLVSAIEWYCDEFEKRTGIKCNLKLDDSDFSDSQINLTFFRVLQETLTNVIRHARASSVLIKLHKLQKGVTMTIQDNGIGIPEEMIGSTKSLGLISMHERAKQFNGTIDISSKEGEGTKLTIFIPYK